MDFKNEKDLAKRYGTYAFGTHEFKSPSFGKSYVTLESKFEKYSFYHDDPKNWKTCPICKTKPMIWEFDNGNYAKCTCYGYYSSGVSAVDLGTYMRENNGSMLDFPDAELMDNWNERCHELKIILNDGKKK